MTTTRPFRVLLSLLLAFTHLTAGAQAAPELKFRFQYPTKAKTTEARRASALTPEFNDKAFSDFGGLIAQAKNDNILPEDWATKPPTLWIYLPNQEIYLAHRHALAAEARRQFEASYPNVKLKVEIRPLTAESGFRAAFKNTMARIKKLRESDKAKDRPEIQAKLDVVEQTAQETYEETKKFYQMRAGTTRLIKDGAAFTRALIVGGVRFGQTVPATIHYGGLPLATSLFLTVFDASAEYFIVKHTQKLQRYFAMPLIKTNSAGFNEISSTVQNIILNMIVFNVGRSVIMQAIQHIATPMAIGMPTGNTVYDIVKWTLGGSIIYVGFNKGYNQAIDKGWISASQVDVGLQVPGIGDAISPVLNTDDRFKPYRPLVFIPQWIFYAAVGVLGYLLPRKADRILAFDASLSNEVLESEIFPEQPSSAKTPIPIRDEKDYKNVVRLVRLDEQRAKTGRRRAKVCKTALSTESEEPKLDATADEEPVN